MDVETSVGRKMVEEVVSVRAEVVVERKGKVVERELDKIAGEHGTISPELVVKEARNRNHPLHRFFDWNDKSAGMKYRLEQAADMIRASKYLDVLQNAREVPLGVEEVPEGEVRRMRAYLPTYEDRVFVPRATVLDDREMREAFVERKIGELRGWCNSVSDVEELRSLWEKILRSIDKR